MHPSNYSHRRRGSGHRDGKDNSEVPIQENNKPTSTTQLEVDANLTSSSDLENSINLTLDVEPNLEYYNITYNTSISSNEISNGPLSNSQTMENSHDEDSLWYDKQNNVTSERERRRSGSWTGVNESDEDMEHISKVCSVKIQAPVDSSASIGNYGSVGSTSDCPLIIPEITASQRNCQYNVTCDTYSISSTAVDAEDLNLVDDLNTVEEKIKRKLKFFFMNPVEKWHAKRRFPWKLLVQIIKIMIVTAQLCTFASQRYNHVTYLWDTRISFSHLFIKGWETAREVTSYPPSTGPLALYKISDYFDFIDYAILMFSDIESSAIGAYKYEYVNNSVRMPTFCLSQYAHGATEIGNFTTFSNSDIKRQCIQIPSSVINDTKKWSTKDFLNHNNVTINFDLLLDSSLFFVLQTMKLISNQPVETPECYSLEATIFFDNNAHDGQMLIDLDIGAMVLDCKGAELLIASQELSYLHSIRKILNILTICICLLSFLMCLRAIYRAHSLRLVINKFFKIRFNRSLSLWEKFEFINLWYVLICMNDIIIILGSVIKIGLESQKERFSSLTYNPYNPDNPDNVKDNSFDYEGYLDKWNVCSLLLGMGNLLIWFGCLRYLGFFETYNVLILTIRSCIPNVMRYSICILMVFAGYSFCGWLVLGPYHFKFRSLSSTIECLYSLVNGDDMFATFSSTVGKDWLVWWFSRIYLYTFISLFIYVILSLFIAIIMDAYETIKSYYEVGFPESDLCKFASECRDDPGSGAYHDEERTIQDIVNSIFCCCHRLRHPTPGYDPLPT